MSDDHGNSVSATLETLSGYHLTALTAVAALERALAGAVPRGFSTASQAFGKEFILSFPNTDLRWEEAKLPAAEEPTPSQTSAGRGCAEPHDSPPSIHQRLFASVGWAQRVDRLGHQQAHQVDDPQDADCQRHSAEHGAGRGVVHLVQQPAHRHDHDDRHGQNAGGSDQQQ